ncbi:MAG: peptidoglycan-binding protein, partial [Pseudomonadota bacterium]
EITGSYNALTKACVVAFQRHFRQSNVDGIADVQTIATLDALVSSVS